MDDFYYDGEWWSESDFIPPGGGDADDDSIQFMDLSETELRQWVLDNPSLVDDPDVNGDTPLCVAVELDLVDLVEWLIDEKGASVNRVGRDGSTPLHGATSHEMITILLKRGAEPALPNSKGCTALMEYLANDEYISAIRLLKYPSGRATIDAQGRGGITALHLAAHSPCDPDDIVSGEMIEMLFRSGVNTNIRDVHGRTGLDVLESRLCDDPDHPASVMARQVPNAQTAALLVKARRIVILAAQGGPPGQAPSYLQSRIERGKALPRVEMASAMAPRDGSEITTEVEEQQRRLHTAVAFVVGIDGPKGKTLPAGLFVGIMDFLMPFWDPLRECTGGLEMRRFCNKFLEDVDD